jgi:hypothetical protein
MIELSIYHYLGTYFDAFNVDRVCQPVVAATNATVTTARVILLLWSHDAPKRATNSLCWPPSLHG